jgi:hypothetical protein
LGHHDARAEAASARAEGLFSLYAPEVERIGKGKVKALPGNPCDGHTLETVIPDMEALVGNTIARILADKGYRGTMRHPFRAFLSGKNEG